MSKKPGHKEVARRRRASHGKLVFLFISFLFDF